MCESPPAVVIIDAYLPPMGGPKFLSYLRGIPELRLIPVIVIAGSEDAAIVHDSVQMMADGILSKPLSKRPLLETVSKLVNVSIERTWEELPPLQRTVLHDTVSVFNDCCQLIRKDGQLPVSQIRESCQLLVKALLSDQIGGILKGVKGHDNYTYVHSLRIAIFLMLLGRTIGMDGEELTTLAMGGLLHDIGKTVVPLEILNKPGNLSPEEWVVMKSHVAHTQKILGTAPNVNAGVSIIALQHHEKLDGSGYPKGIKGKDFNELARMASIVDIYGALTDRRPYKIAITPEEAMSIMQRMNGQLDQHLLDMFRERLLGAVHEYG